MNLIKIIQLKIISRMFDKGKYVKVSEKLYKLNNINSMEYIWYCPRTVSCGAIVLKTNKPFLPIGKSYICKRCQTVHTSEILINHNKKNIKKYLDSVKT